MATQTKQPQTAPVIQTGVPGLDTILGSGLPGGHIYLVQGLPGTGKTTIALQFLLEGARRGEKVLYITLAQTRQELEEIGRSHGLEIDKVSIADLSPESGEEFETKVQTVIQTRSIELEQTMEAVETVIAEQMPDRVVLDSLIELQLLSASENLYRREFLNLKGRLLRRGCTALLLDTWSKEREGEAVRIEALVHGVLRLDWHLPDYGIAQRRIAISKLRGHAFVEGYHDMHLETGGAIVFPRLNINQGHVDEPRMTVGAGIADLDDLSGGGFETGTTCLVSGNAGTGKSTLCTAYARQAARDGHNAAVFLFEERTELFKERARALSMDLDADDVGGRVSVYDFDPAEVSPGQLFAEVQEKVAEGARVVVIDSLTGFLKSLPPHEEIMLHFHPLLDYLSRQNVLTFLVLDLRGAMASQTPGEVDLSFLADSIVVLRQYQSKVTIRRSIGVMKKRYGPHATDLRELRITSEGVKVVPISEDVDISHQDRLTAI